MLSSGAPNLSLWAFLATVLPPVAKQEFGRAARSATAGKTPAPLEKKVYVTLQTNEGDTPKIVAGLFGGTWLNPQRGSAPVAWGVNLLLARTFPHLMEYYATTATANDTFFGGTSGAGYVYPSEMPPRAFEKYAAQAQAAAADFAAAPAAGNLADWAVDIWNWGVPEGKAGTSPGEIPWPKMIQDYAAAAPAIGAWTQQSLSANATTVCVKLPTRERNRSYVPVSFAPQKLWYPGQGPAAWSGSTPSFDSALSDLEARVRATERDGQTVFTLIYGLVYSGPGGLDAISASLELSKRLPAVRHHQNLPPLWHCVHFTLTVLCKYVRYKIIVHETRQ